MSRRDKQADLRRRMAEARSKLISSQSNNDDHESNQGNDDAAAAGKKRPLPPSTGGGDGSGSGGILRKSKYNNTLTTSTSSSSVPSSTNTSSSKIKNADDGGGPKNNALGSLMAGYDDSSSDDEGDAKSPPATVENQHHGASVPFDLRGSEMDEEPIMNEKRKKSKKKKKKKNSIDAATNVSLSDDKTETNAHESPKETSITPEENGKAAAISDEVWDEFNSLLDDGDAKATSDAANNQPAKSEENSEPLAAEAPLPTTAATERKTEKKSKKKKKKKVAAKDMYDTEAINNVEQASYEARLARLMLLKSKKAHHKKSDEETADTALLPSANEFYDPGLAFHKDDGEDATEGDKSMEYDVTTPKPDKSEGGMAASMGTTSNAPRVSLAKILRGRRDQARKLSSRGNDAGGNEFDAANDEALDGRWF